jgi:hypothetical protein
MALPGVTLLALTCTGIAPAPAQQAATSAAPPPLATAPKPDIEPEALEILKAMSNKLQAAKSVSFSVKIAFDEPAKNGQPLFYMVQSAVSLQRPNKLKVVVSGDGPPSQFFYDGKTMMEFLPKENLVAVADAPPTLEEMFDDAYENAGIYFPFVHYIVDGSYEKMIEGLTSAFVIGQSSIVGATTTDIVAVANDNVQAQIWIGAEDKLPRLSWLTFTHASQKPRRMAEFADWKLDGSVDTVPPDVQGARKIEFARPDATLPK